MSPVTKKKKSSVIPAKAVPHKGLPQPKDLKEKAANPERKGKGHSLVIVESPTKQKTIAKFLGSGYTIIATLGHIRDLPSRSAGRRRRTKILNLSMSILPKAKKVIPGLKEAVKNADRVYLATDFDREGEAIAWHVAEVLEGVPADRVSRITFHEITPSAIQESLDASPAGGHDAGARPAGPAGPRPDRRL